MATATRMTAEQYYEVSVEGDCKQLVDGQIVQYRRPLIRGLLQGRLGAALGNWVSGGENRGLALLPTDVHMDEHNVYGPDLLWFSEQRRPKDLDADLERIPDLCVELRAKGIWCHDIGAKMRVYEDGGLPELWLVDHAAESVLVYRRSHPESRAFDVSLELLRGDTLTSPQLPGFALPLDELFERS